MDLTLEARNATLSDMAEILKDQRARRLDVVASATAITAEGGQLRIDGTEQVLTDEGVTSAAGLYRPTNTCDSGLADKLGIPPAYLRKLRTERPDLYDANVNGWLHGGYSLEDSQVPGGGYDLYPTYPPDGRKFMVRLLRGDEQGTGVARAVVSSKYGIIDNLDVLVATLDGVRQAEAQVEVTSCDLTENRMIVKVAAPSIRALAPKLLEGYRNPFTGEDAGGGWTPQSLLRAAEREGKAYVPGTEPVIFAGFVISNNEVGEGGFTIAPQLTVEVCGNHCIITADALKRRHLGARQEEGVVNWSHDTLQKQLAWITAQARDAVAEYLTPAYVEAKITEMEALAGVPVTDPATTIKEIVRTTVIPAELENDVLNFFIRGGQLTAGGVMQAVTAAAQTVADAELAYEMEAMAVQVLGQAAKIG